MIYKAPSNSIISEPSIILWGLTSNVIPLSISEKIKTRFYVLMKRGKNNVKWKEREEKRNCKSISKGWMKEGVSYDR